MQRLRWWYAALLVWFFVLFNVERLHGTINLASMIYVLAPALALAVVVTPRLHQASLVLLALLAATVVVPAKLWLGYAVSGPALPLTLTEIGAIAVTGLLAGRIRCGFDEFADAVAAAMTSQIYDRSQTFLDGQSEMCREIRRARVHQRPLALLAVRPAGEIPEIARQHFTQEVERSMIGKYIAASLGELLTAELRDSDIIAFRDGHFLVLMPEATRERVERVTARLTKSAQGRLGLELEMGASVFPDEEITFVRLVDRAEAQMRGEAETIQPAVPTIDAPRELALKDTTVDAAATVANVDALEVAVKASSHSNGKPR